MTKLQRWPITDQKFVQWTNNCPVHEQSIRAVGDLVLRCNTPVCAVGNLVLHEPTQQNASGEAVYTNTVDIGQFLRTRAVGVAERKSIAFDCKLFTKPKSLEGARMVRNSIGLTNTFPCWTHSSHRILIQCALTGKVPSWSPLYGT